MDYWTVGDLRFFNHSITPSLQRRAAVAGSDFGDYA